MGNQDNKKNDFDFIRPLTTRPDIDPDINFVNSLRNELIQKSLKINQIRTPKLVPFTIGSLTVITCFALSFLLFNSKDIENEAVTIHDPDDSTPISIDSDEILKGEDDIPIDEYESITPILKMEYGTESGEIGEIQHTPGGSGLGPMSFFVKNDVFYILDNSGKKIIVTTKDQHHFTIQLNDDSWLTDIFVDDDQNIYVLDTSYNRSVSKYNKAGNLIENFPVDASSSFIPTGVSVNDNNDILVNQLSDRTLNLMSGEYEYANEKMFYANRKNEDFGEIILNETGNEQIIDIPFEHSYGGIDILSVKGNQVFFKKIEVSPDTPKIMIEMHMYVVDKKGAELGAVRIPHEKSEYSPTHNIRIDQDKIYYLSPEQDGLFIYLLTPGQKFEKRLQEKIDAYWEKEGTTN